MTLEESLTSFYNLTHIPVRLCRDDEVFATHSHALLTADYENSILATLQNASSDFCHLITPEYLLYGFFRLDQKNHYVLLGPAISVHNLEEQTIQLIHAQKACPYTPDSLRHWLRKLPDLTVQQFLTNFNFLHEILTHSRYAYSKAVSYSESYTDFSTSHTEQFSPEQLPSIIENEMVSFVEYGNTQALTERIQSIGNLSFFPSYTMNTMRTMRNIFIVSMSLCSRAAIRGGMDYMRALNASNEYMNHIERLFSYPDIENELFNMMFYYADEVAKVHAIPLNSPLIRRVSNYVQIHLNEKITAGEIAESLDISPSYLCHHFHDQTGQKLTDYIISTKIREARRLLQYSEFTLKEISSQLGFSSQQYFQNVFKKETGMTPNEFRTNALPR